MVNCSVSEAEARRSSRRRALIGSGIVSIVIAILIWVAF